MIEDGFAEIVMTLEPSRSLLRIARTVFRDLWEARLARAVLDEKHIGLGVGPCGRTEVRLRF